jgi:hypothetical protein
MSDCRGPDVTQRYDAGVRMSEQLAKDMISVRIGPDIRFAVVGTPSYFKKNPEPSCPQDLVRLDRPQAK